MFLKILNQYHTVRHGRTPRDHLHGVPGPTMDGKVLDYGDTLLRVRDVALLTGPHWLNDAVMNFYFEYLRRTNASAGDENASNKVVFIDASVSFLLANMDASEAGVILEQTGANQAEHVLLLVRPLPSYFPPCFFLFFFVTLLISKTTHLSRPDRSTTTWT